jgi:alpha-L-fucosidase
VREFVEAVRDEGLRVGLYYSLLDWHHKDYPKYNDKFHPMRGNPAFKDEKIDFENYLRYMHGQVEELCSQYGKIDIMWFDFSYDKMTSVTWRAADLIRMVRKYQPDILIDNRLEGSGSDIGTMINEHPSECAGNFASPEHFLPEQGLVNKAGKSIPWELCTTMNNNWGYVPSDTSWKSAPLILHKLVECVSKNGNMILNVGPDSYGRFPPASLLILEQLASWMRDNAESIHHCGASMLPRPDWGRYTRNGNIVYAHLFEEPIGPISLTGLSPEQISRVTLLRDGSEVRDAATAIGVRNICHTKFVTLGQDPNHTYPLPDSCDTVLRIELKESI